MATEILIFFYLNLFTNFKYLKLCAWAVILVADVGVFVSTILIAFERHPVRLPRVQLSDHS